MIDIFGGDMLDWFSKQTEALVGLHSPGDQIVASIVLGVALIATSSIGLVFTLLLLPVPIFFGLLGVLRLIPPVEDRWPV